MAMSGRQLLYFFAYKTEFFCFQNNRKNIDPSYKTDLDLWDCLRRSKTHIIAKLQRLDLFVVFLERGKNPVL